MSEKQNELHAMSQKINLARLYQNGSRQADFSANSKIEGTREWAIREAMGLMYATRDDERYTDERCNKIMEALK